jgi:hypothetical protein
MFGCIVIATPYGTERLFKSIYGGRHFMFWQLYNRGHYSFHLRYLYERHTSQCGAKLCSRNSSFLRVPYLDMLHIVPQHMTAMSIKFLFCQNQ